MKTIVSAQNEQLKKVAALRDKKFRDRSGLMLVEGENIVKELPEDCDVREVYIKASEAERYGYLPARFGKEGVLVDDRVFSKISDTVSPAGVIAVVGIPSARPVGAPVVLLADGIRDAGNLGTMIRSAKAMGVGDVIVADGVDPFCPKTVRSSLGAVLGVNVVVIEDYAALDGLIEGYRVLALDMGGTSVYDYCPEGPIVIAVGNEAHGLSQVVRRRADAVLAIPMRGAMESLNAAVSASIAMSVLTENVAKATNRLN